MSRFDADFIETNVGTIHGALRDLDRAGFGVDAIRAALSMSIRDRLDELRAEQDPNADDNALLAEIATRLPWQGN